VTLKDGFPYGTSNTLLFVETGEPVPWTKPAELPFDPVGPLPALRGLQKPSIFIAVAGRGQAR
jgi:hypothetical protein